MPYKISKVRNKRCYEVRHGSHVSARCTSRKNAERQVRLLRGVEHGMTPRGR